jgi:predicted MFS family arabinose efflux permease
VSLAPTATTTTTRQPPMPAVLWALLFGNFVIGTGVMIVGGTLNEISTGLHVSVPKAAELTSAGSLLMCVSAPIFAALVAGWDRRRLLTLSLVWYALLHLACAAAPTFSALLPLRVLAMLAPAIFTPQAAACTGLLVPPEQRGRGITFVFLGWSVASVLGMPIGAYLGGTFGWHSAFAAVGVLALVGAAWVWRALPDGVRPAALSRSAWAQAFGSPALMTCIAVTVLYAAGQSVLFAYLAPYLRQKIGVSAGELSVLLMWFGAWGFAGNMMMSRNIDRVGAARSVIVGVCVMALSLLLWPLGTSFLLAAIVAVPWALGCFATNSAQQARLVGIAPPLAAGSIALNSSAMYAGQAIGTAGGGWLIVNTGTMDQLHWVGFTVLLLAAAGSAWASRLQEARLTAATAAPG